MVKITRHNTGITVNMSRMSYEIMNITTPRGCPFDDYTLLNLLKDLVEMYSWKLCLNKAYSLNSFLNECNDIHAETYRNEFMKVEV